MTQPVTQPGGLGENKSQEFTRDSQHNHSKLKPNNTVYMLYGGTYSVIDMIGLKIDIDKWKDGCNH